MRVDLADFDGNTRYAVYDNFRVSSAEEKYKLTTVGSYSGDAGESYVNNDAPVVVINEVLMDRVVLSYRLIYQVLFYVYSA